ncbi:calponin homology domain-containing protein, partial [Globomyces pollinis-pini]
DKGWEVIQKKTFTNWINTQLKVRDIAPIVNVVTDSSTGEMLIILLGKVNRSLGKMNSKPKMRLQMIENCNIALNFVKCRGVHLTNIGSEDIVDCNEKLILGLIWTIILRFTISTISEEGLSAKEGLLLWCQRKTIPYRSDYEIKDFTTSWTDGLALCGLIHSHRPDLIDYWALNKKNKFENTKLAFEIAEKYLGIPQLFAVEDIVDVVRPDERSVITYIAQYFHKLTVINKFQTAGSQIEQLGLHHQRLTQMQMLYENRAKELISSINIIQFTWNESKLTSYEDARNELTQFYTYKKNLKREWMVEKFELYSILDSIQEEAMKLNTFQYDPPAEVCLRTLNNHWFKLEAAELNRYRQLKDFMNDDKQRLLDKFINGAMDFQKQLQHLSIQLSMIDGDIDEMIHQTDLLVRQIFPLKLHLEALSDTYNQCVKRNIGDVE